MMPIGKLNRCITLERKTVVRDSFGGTATTWATLVIVRAAYNYRTGRETFEAAQETSIDDVKFTIRYRSDITAGDTRVVYDSETYDILGIGEDEKRRYLNLTCRKKSVNQEQ